VRRFAFKVAVELERQHGLFAGYTELSEVLKDVLEEANPGEVEGDRGGEYEVTLWEVEVVDAPLHARLGLRRGK
jgi:hypothetical protein